MIQQEMRWAGGQWPHHGGGITCELWGAIEDWGILEQIWAWKLCWPHRRGLRGKQAIEEAQQGLGSNILRMD